MPSRHYNEARAFITSGLQDVSLTRARLTWGVTVPWDPEHVFYVWFDALLNYYTALSYARPGKDLTAEFWPATYHVIGKDILKFHTVFWPALLMAAELPLPEHVFVHGFLLGSDGRKMSKSLGNVLDPFEVIESYGTDALRFYLMRDVPFGGDGAVGIDAVRTRYESELANEYGNLASRTIAMVRRYRDGDRSRRSAPIPRSPRSSPVSATEVAALLDRAEATQALELIWQRVRRLNRYVEEQAPWKLAKEPDRADELDGCCARSSRGCASSRSCSSRTSPRLRSGCSRPCSSATRATPLAEWQPEVGGATDELEPLFPKAVIDSHTHLHLCHPSDAELVEAAADGRRDEAAHRRHRLRELPRGALPRPSGSRRCGPRSAVTRTPPPASTTTTSPSSRRSPPTPAAWRSARRDSTSTATGRPRPTSAAPSPAQIELARETDKPLVIHTRERRRRDARDALRARRAD